MNKNEQILFSLLWAGLNIKREEFPAESSLFLSSTDWHTVFKLSAEQNVIAIAWNGLQKLHKAGVIADEQMPPRTGRLSWALSAEQVDKIYRKQEGTIAKLAVVFAKHNIPLMVLKGYGLSLNYPQPNLRKCSDIDIWTMGNQEESDRVLHEELKIDIDDTKHHHTVFYVDGQMIENHFDFINIQAHLSNREIERKLKQYAAKDYTTHQVNGTTILLPSAQFNGTFILRHSAAHFAAERINIRHLLDWLYFVKKDYQRIDWEELRELCREQNMLRFFNVMNTICVDYLGMNPQWIPCFEREDELEERVLNEILHPEFGEKADPKSGFFERITFKTRRWWHNRWKHRIVYKEGLFVTFVVQVFSHLYKPSSL